jgi:FlaA1/EpsC-like NDP-sugar epimerase
MDRIDTASSSKPLQPDLKPLEGKTILITGAGGMLGRALRHLRNGRLVRIYLLSPERRSTFPTGRR